MPSKGGRRQQEKRLKFQIKSALISNQDPFPLFQKLAQLLNQNKQQKLALERTYSLNELEIEPTFPDYKDIPRGDPRRLAYKLRNLFGTGFQIILPPNYPILPPVNQS